MELRYEPVERHETRYWYAVFNDQHLRRADRPPKDLRPTVVESCEFVEDSTFTHVLVCTHVPESRSITTKNGHERLTKIPTLVAEMLDCIDRINTTEIDGKRVPVYREWLTTGGIRH